VLDTVLAYLREPLIVLSGTPVTTITLLTALAIVIVARIISAVIGRSLERVLEARGVDRGLRFAVGKISRYVVIVLGVFVAIGTIGIDTSAILGTGAVLLVGIGFGLQKLAENFISGLLVLIERPVRKGDFIDAGGVLGTVEDIGLRATRVMSRDGVMVIVPNANLISSTVINYGQPTPERRMWVDVGVAYGTDLELAVRVLNEVAAAEPMVLPKPAPEVRHMGFNESSVHLSLIVWIGEAREDLIAGSKLRFAIDRAFRDHKIHIPFPQREVHMIPPKQVA
jgi:small-conductance mechanosensitive channel